MTTIAEKPRRRWLRFSLRSLLLLVLVVAVSLFAYIKLRQQGIAVAALKPLGCKFEYQPAARGWGTVLEGLRQLVSEDDFGTVVGIDGTYSQFTDAEMVHI